MQNSATSAIEPDNISKPMDLHAVDDPKGIASTKVSLERSSLVGITCPIYAASHLHPSQNLQSSLFSRKSNGASNTVSGATFLHIARREGLKRSLAHIFVFTFTNSHCAHIVNALDLPRTRGATVAVHKASTSKSVDIRALSRIAGAINASERTLDDFFLRRL